MVLAARVRMQIAGFCRLSLALKPRTSLSLYSTQIWKPSRSRSRPGSLTICRSANEKREHSRYALTMVRHAPFPKPFCVSQSHTQE